MGNDFDEFVQRLGRDVPIYRFCQECDDITIVNPTTYDKPKVVCNPGYCEKSIPFCVCRGNGLYTDREIKACQYPDCPKTPPDEYDYDNDDFGLITDDE